MDKKSIGARIKQARNALNLTQDMIAARADATSKRGLQDNEAGNSVPGGAILSALIESGINANWVLTGEGEMLLSDIAKGGVDLVLRSGSEIHVIEAKEPGTHPYGFVLVPRYDVAASMGNGSVIHSEQIVDHLAFREEWVRTELGTTPKNLVLISAIGDSMEPTLRAGDLLLIDRSSASVKQDAIYAFATNGELRVKRMQLKIDGTLVVKSDNSQYETETLCSDQASSLRIVGRVVWSGRRM